MIKDTICGKLKGRTCADGRPQRCYIPKEFEPSPTISVEGLITSLIIDAHKGRDVTIFIPLEHTLTLIFQRKIHHIKIEGEFMDIMCKVDPEHRKSMHVEMV